MSVASAGSDWSAGPSEPWESVRRAAPRTPSQESDSDSHTVVSRAACDTDADTPSPLCLLTTRDMPSEKTMSKASENRRSTKPIMEKRRRARINNSLTELKNLILDALKKDNARHSKLEKADILEMTVRHLQNLQRQQSYINPDADSVAQFRSGFAECAREVSRFIGRNDGLETTIRQRLLSHLAGCLNGISGPLHVQTSREVVAESSGLRLVPTRLPNGDLAFLLPATVYTPSTVPVSPISSTSSPLSSPSPIHIVASSGILSPATSDRCSPSPVMSAAHCPVIVPPVNHHKPESPKSVWRPF